MLLCYNRQPRKQTFNNHWHWNITVTDADDLLTDHIACPWTGPGHNLTCTTCQVYYACRRSLPKDPIAVFGCSRIFRLLTLTSVASLPHCWCCSWWWWWQHLAFGAAAALGCCQSWRIWVTLLPVSTNICILAVAIYHVGWGNADGREAELTAHNAFTQHTRVYTHCSEYFGSWDCVFIK